MTRDEGVALIKQQLAFRTTLDDAIVTQMKFAQTTLEAMPTKPWFLVSDWETLTTVVDTEDVALPTDFLLEVEEAHLYYRPSDWPTHSDRKLVKDDYDDLKAAFTSLDEEQDTTETDFTPRAYALIGNNLAIFPTPDDAYTLRWKYYQKQTVLTTDVENNWLKYVPMLLLGHTLKLISKGPIRDVVAPSIADEWIAMGMEELRRWEEMRKSANREDQIGGRHW